MPDRKRTVIGLAEIKQIIPHRYPILLVDSVSAVEPGRRLTAHKAVTGHEPCYAGLDDDATSGDYAYPMSLLLESWAQAAVLLVLWERPNPDVLADKVELFAAISKAELLGPVFPGDVLEHRVELVRAAADAALLTGASFVNGRKILQIGTYTLVRREIDALSPGIDGASARSAGHHRTW